MNLYIDIETIPTQRQDVCDWLEESMRDELTLALESVCAPSNYKDAEKIAEFCANKKAALQSEFLDKLRTKIESTGLDGAFGQVFCIGWALDGGAVTTAYGMNEQAVLRDFAKMLRIPASELFTSTVIGHNVSAFDLRFLTQRYIVNGIKPPLAIGRAAEAKPWEKEKVFDTMVQWAGPGGRIGLDKLCMALSVPSPKGELDGSKVWEWVQAERYDEVARYCERDVEAVRAVHQRMTFVVAPAVEMAEAA